MRKEVKRSLVIWPSIASTAIVGMSYLPGFVNPALDIVSKSLEYQTSARLVATQTWHNFRAEFVTDQETWYPSEAGRVESATAMHRSVTAPELGLDLVERTEQGTRAMKLPMRLNFVLGSSADDGTLFAPVVDIRHELAGLGQAFPSTDPVAAPSSDLAIQSKLGNQNEPSQRIPEAAELSAPSASSTRAPQPVIELEPSDSHRLPTSIAVLAKVAPSLNPPAQLPSLIHREAKIASGISSPESIVLTPSPGQFDHIDSSRQNSSASSAAYDDWSAHRLEPSEVDAIIDSLQLSISGQNSSPDHYGSVIQGKPFAMLQSPAEPKVAVESRGEKPLATTLSPSGNPASWPLTTVLHDQLSLLAGRVDTTQAMQQAYVSSRSLSKHQWIHAPKEHMISARIVEGSTTDKAGHEKLDTAEWAQEVADILNQLQSLDRLGDPRAGGLLTELDRLAQFGVEQAEQLDDPEERRRCLCAAFAVNRRLAVWQPVWRVTQGDAKSWDPDSSSLGSAANIRSLIQAVEEDALATNDAQGWRRFLLLDELSVAAEGKYAADRAILAQRFLSRLQWHALDARHVAWLQRSSIMELAAAIRPWTRQAIDYAELLQELEQQESDQVEDAGNHVAGAVQSLRFAEESHLAEVANAIDTHYRNANLRVAISAELLNRMLPNLPANTVPVRTTVLGNQVRGSSHVSSDLELLLHPAPDRWSLSLKTLGKVQTESTGYRGPVAVRTSGNANFVAMTPIDVTLSGIRVSEPQVSVQGHSQLRNVRSTYDNVPLVSDLVRNIATSRYESMAPLSNRIANDRMRSQIGETIDQTVDERVAEATARLQSAVLNPLARLQLNPKVIDLQTTDQRLLARYRLAGDWQLAAFTPRPRAPHASLMSLQVHESAINNALEQLLPASAEKTIDDLIRDAALSLGTTPEFSIEDIPDDLTIQFSKSAPISIEFEDDQLWVTMRVLRLNRGDKMRLSRFIVRAAYRPEIDGNQISLVRDGHLRISGVGMSMRERLPARAIFNKVFSPTRKMPLMLPQIREHEAVKDLVITQLELRDGWIAMALGHPHHERIALAAQVSPASSHK